MEDESATFTCTYRGLEPPITQTRWLKDGEPIKESGRYQMTEKPNVSTLVITSADVVDNGLYNCEITTKGYRSIVSQKALLNVQEKLKFSPEPSSRRLELNSTTKVLYLIIF